MIIDIENFNEAAFETFIAVVVCIDRSWIGHSLLKRIETMFYEEDVNVNMKTCIPPK